MNYKKWEKDTKGNSIAYFSKIDNPVINSEAIEELKILSENNTVRFCLHKSPEDNLQDMIILTYKNQLSKVPHKHTNSNEAVQIIEGKMLALTFDKSGNLTSSIILTPKYNSMLRNKQNVYHLFIPLSNPTIYREVIGGKFKPAVFLKAKVKWEKN